MLWGKLHSLLASYANPAQKAINAVPSFQFSQDWKVLGPFQIGTREAIWGADPLQHHGGFHSLDYDEHATFRSSLAINGTVGWTAITGNLTTPNNNQAGIDLLVDFPYVEWESLRNIYGWAAYQWQAWMRGEIVVHFDSVKILTLRTPQILEFWVDDVLYFGGDYYSYARAPLTLKLQPGRHRLDIR